MSFDRRSYSKRNVAIIVAALIISIFSIGISTADTPPVTLQPAIENDETHVAPASFETEDGLSYIERRVRMAAVKVLTPRGHGSGSYMTLEGFRVVVTAQHVASGDIGDLYRVANPETEEVVGGRLVYSDPVHDVAVILVAEMKTRRPMQFRLRRDPILPGTQILYAGHPSFHSLLLCQ